MYSQYSLSHHLKLYNMDRLGYSQINFLFILTLIQRDDGQKKQTLEERTTEPGV